MRILVTGASGFLGQATVMTALDRGHTVRGLVRPAAELEQISWSDRDNVEVARGDLRSRKRLAGTLDGVDAVIHAAAKVGGDLYAQLEGAVVATENLLDTMREAGVKRLVLVSSFSVYGYLARKTGDTIDESSPLEEELEARDDYAIAKTEQERLVRGYAEKEGWGLTVARPGVIYGPGRLFNARLGSDLSPRTWLRIGGGAQVPLTYVENCAEALVIAAESQQAIGETLNLVDNAAPTQRAYIAALRSRLSPSPRVIGIPWTLWRAVAGLAWWTNRRIFHGRAKLPSILVPARAHARFKPLQYPNAHVRRVLDWEPTVSMEEALDRCLTKP
jgi:nucleoside-diphosphate-sugar epimerase